MSPVIDQQLEAVQQLCRRHYVARLELFGSAANGNFDSTESDLDFLVEFEPLSPSDRADAYFGLLATLQDLFGREIDLVEVEAVTNPYFLQSLAATRKVLYAA
jgi:predicted nucleotidyltransferase